MQILEARGKGGEGGVRPVADVWEEGVIKMRAVRDGEYIREERGKVVSLTEIVGKRLVVVEKRVAGSGFIPSKAMEGIPVFGRVNGEVGVEPCNCVTPIPAFFGNQKVAHVSL